MGRAQLALASAIVGVLAGGAVTLVLELGDEPGDVADDTPTPGPGEPGADREPGAPRRQEPGTDGEPDRPAADREVADRSRDGRLSRTSRGGPPLAVALMLLGAGVASGLARGAVVRPIALGPRR